MDEICRFIHQVAELRKEEEGSVVSVLRSIGSFFIAQVLFGKPSLLV
jgi:hypothetical protein